MSATKERPILFSGPMVRAILDGRKTQTRPLVKPQPKAHACEGGWPQHMDRMEDGSWCLYCGACGWSGGWRCPYGVPGDRLWVRESVLLSADRDGHWATYSATPRTCKDYSGAVWDIPNDQPTPTADELVASGEWRRRPSIHMPRWASRITLEVTDLRVQRVQETTESDARAEGIIERDTPDEFSERSVVARDGKRYLSVGSAWAALWDAINGKRAPWSSNPWVWAVTFRRVLA